jgi:hypothetical protein
LVLTNLERFRQSHLCSLLVPMNKV